MKKSKIRQDRQTDYMVAGEILMSCRELLKEEMSINQKIEALKTAHTAVKNRLDSRAETRKDALAQIQVDEHNKKFNRNIKIVNIELKDFND